MGNQANFGAESPRFRNLRKDGSGGDELARLDRKLLEDAAGTGGDLKRVDLGLSSRGGGSEL